MKRKNIFAFLSSFKCEETDCQTLNVNELLVLILVALNKELFLLSLIYLPVLLMTLLKDTKKQVLQYLRNVLGAKKLLLDVIHTFNNVSSVLTDFLLLVS